MQPSRLRTLSQNIGLIGTSLASWLFMVASPVQAQTTAPWEGVCVYEDVATIQGLQCLVGNVLQIAITAIGFAGFIMLVVGAFKWLLSGGNSKGTDSARNTMTYAIIGLVVALSSFVILNLIAQFTGVETILQFQIPDPDTRVQP